jgi:hypothetical protein
MPFIYSYYFLALMATLIPITLNINAFPLLFKLFIILVYLVWIIQVSYIRLARYSSIYLIKREHVSNFFTRKKDDLILALIAAIIGATLGVVGTILSSKYLHI